MSRYARIPEEVIPKLSAGTALVYLALAVHANEAGTCFPGIATIATAAGIGVSSAWRALDLLVTAGLIKRTSLSGKRTGWQLVYLPPPTRPKNEMGTSPKIETAPVSESRANPSENRDQNRYLTKNVTGTGFQREDGRSRSNLYAFDADGKPIEERWLIQHRPWALSESHPRYQRRVPGQIYTPHPSEMR